MSEKLCNNCAGWAKVERCCTCEANAMRLMVDQYVLIVTVQKLPANGGSMRILLLSITEVPLLRMKGKSHEVDTRRSQDQVVLPCTG